MPQTPEPQTPDDPGDIIAQFFKDLDDAVDRGQIRVVFWTCPDDTHRGVIWTTTPDGRTEPTCTTCGTTGAPR